MSQIDATEIVRGKRYRHEIDKAEEEQLMSIVLGNDRQLIDNIAKKAKSAQYSSDESDDDQINGPGDSDGATDCRKNVESNDSLLPVQSGESSSVWKDDDDEIDVAVGMKHVNKLPRLVQLEGRYKDYLESKFRGLNETPSWAEKGLKKSKRRQSDDDSSDDDLSKTVGDVFAKSEQLATGQIDIKRCEPLNADNPAKNMINCVEFHRSSTVGMVSTCNGCLDLFQVDGKTNAKIQSIHFKNYPVDRAMFSVDGEQIIVGSDKCHGQFYYYDMMAGKIVPINFRKGKERLTLSRFALSQDGKYIASKGREGYIHFLESGNKSIAFDVKVNAKVTALEFNNDSTKLFVHGTGGTVYIWDVGQRKCIHRFEDEGCFTGTSMALSPNGQYFVTGSDAGVVNVYNYNDAISSCKPQPIKSLMNLTTEVSRIKFNHTSELMSILSPHKYNSIKLVHLPSVTVYSNFPFVGKNYKKITCSDFSPSSGYFAFGTSKGMAQMFRLHQFNDY